MTTTTTITAEFISPHDFIHHPDNRPGGLKSDHIENLARDMKARGFDEDYFVKYCIADDTWPEEHSALMGKRVLLGGHHRIEAAKKANLAAVPAKLKPMSYAGTLEFLDRDNEHSPLHWFEKLILWEKRREMMGLSAVEFGEKVLGYKSNYGGASKAHIYNQYSTRWAVIYQELIGAGITTNDLEGITMSAALNITRCAPGGDFRALFKDCREGILPSARSKLYSALKARYAPIAPRTVVPNDTSYLYIATSPNTSLVKCGMTTGDDPVKYVDRKAKETWALDFSCYFSIDIPTVHIQAADALMKDKLSKGWPAFKEFYTVPPARAKRILLEIAAQYADDEDGDSAVEDEDELVV
jgi:hypothetical protein